MGHWLSVRVSTLHLLCLLSLSGLHIWSYLSSPTAFSRCYELFSAEMKKNNASTFIFISDTLQNCISAARIVLKIFKIAGDFRITIYSTHSCFSHFLIKIQNSATHDFRRKKIANRIFTIFFSTDNKPILVSKFRNALGNILSELLFWVMAHVTIITHLEMTVLNSLVMED